MLSDIFRSIGNFTSRLYLPRIQFIDIVEILIIAVLLYFFMNWIKSTRAYNLLKGMLVVLAFILLASLFQMTTILWLVKSVASIALMALVVIFQPELRKALEKLGQRRFLSSLIPFDINRDTEFYYSDQTINEVVRAAGEMSSTRTGALIVMEQDVNLEEYIATGITLDAVVSSQLLTNIFEHNTPLHDGAAIIRGDRVVSATCYLPLSDSESISKRYGTRHRAGVGISEVSDSFTVIVSEETGRISGAYKGRLLTGLSISELREKLYELQKKYREREARTRRFRLRKNEEQNL